MEISKDAFSTSQILSKIWLAEELEKIKTSNPLRILCFGGWYGITNFILRTRDNLNIELFRNLELDKEACAAADNINKAWEWQDWQFKSIYGDCNKFEYTSNDYNTVINTSSEHMKSTEWFERIPKGTLTIIQSNNMPHEEHCHNHKTVDEMTKDFPLGGLLFSGEKEFVYPEWSFKRFMMIGVK